MSDDEYDTTCPLCVEEMDLSDQNFLPCPCGYKVCMWCWHHIRENLNGLCPACRTPYNSDPHAFSAVDREDVVKLKKEKKQKEKQEKKVGDRVISGGAPIPSGIKPPPTSSIVDRKHLHNYRVVQRNLVYVIGVPSSYATEEILRKADFFGQYGKIGKIVVHRNPTSAHTTVSVYITFVYREDAKACIQALDGYWLDQNYLLRASFGTTKYCNNFIRGVSCSNPECVYLHELGDDDDRFTKEEIQAGHSKIAPVPGKDQTLVTGNGGPSGTGKRPTGDPVLPPPVFIQDNSSSSATVPPVATTSPVAAAAGGSSNSSNISTNSSAMSVPSTPLGPPPGVGVGIVMGRPAPVSRSGTATWGNPNTLATIAGTAPTSTTSSNISEPPGVSSIERKRSGSTPVHYNGMQSVTNVHLQSDDGPSPRGRDRPVTPTTATISTTGPTAPTAVLKRSAANSTISTTHSTDTTISTTDNTSSATTSTTATKIKPKTSREIAAEKRAAIAAAKASLAAQIEATTDNENKNVSTTTVNGGKLTGRQQMLANKAAAKAAAVASLTASEANKSGNTVSVSSDATNNTTGTTNGNSKAISSDSTTTKTTNNDHNNNTVDKASSNTSNNSPMKVESSTKERAENTEKPSLSSDVSDIFPEIPTITSLPLPSLPPVLSTLSPITSSSMLPILDIPPPPYVAPQFIHFNGLSGNAVFPVPFSSLSCSVWGNILQASNEDLSVNPYGQLTTPICELFDLTIPPTDACMSSAPYWPRPLSYYSSGMTSDGCTFTPAGKHNHHRSVADMTQLPPIPLLPPNLTLAPRIDTTSSSTVVGATIPPMPGIAPVPNTSTTNTTHNNTTSSTGSNTTTTTGVSGGKTVPHGPPGMTQPPAKKEGSIDRMAREARESRQRNAAAHSSNSSTSSRSNQSSNLPTTSPASVTATSTAATSGSGSNASFSALRQLFPGVKMSVNNGNNHSSTNK